MKEHLNPDVDTVVDHNHLEWEWFRQSGLYFDYAEAEAEAEAEKGLAKLNIDVVKAEVEESIRNDPESYGLETTTEPAIKAAVARDKRVIKANEDYIRATKVDKILVGALRALEHKKRTLEKADERKLNAIYAEPKAPKYMKGVERSIDKEAGKKLRQSLSKRRRQKKKKR